MSKLIKISLVIIFIAIAGGFGSWFLLGNEMSKSAEKTSLSVSEKNNAANTESETSFSPLSLLKTYKDSGMGFSFNYPDGFNVAEFSEDGGRKSIAMRKTGDQNKTVGFQIYITHYGDNEPDFVVTKERILRDIPDLVIESPLPVDVGGTRGLAFFGKSEFFDDSAEVWFAKNGNFYQISGSKKDAPLLDAVLKSWKFE